jgi:hypothetical protein
MTQATEVPCYVFLCIRRAISLGRCIQKIRRAKQGLGVLFASLPLLALNPYYLESDRTRLLVCMAFHAHFPNKPLPLRSHLVHSVLKQQQQVPHSQPLSPLINLFLRTGEERPFGKDIYSSKPRVSFNELKQKNLLLAG